MNIRTRHVSRQAGNFTDRLLDHSASSLDDLQPAPYTSVFASSFLDQETWATGVDGPYGFDDTIITALKECSITETAV
jgi:hypothetical protein